MSAAGKPIPDATGWFAVAWPIYCDPGRHVVHGERVRRREDGATVCQVHENTPLQPPSTEEDAWAPV